MEFATCKVCVRRALWANRTLPGQVPCRAASTQYVWRPLQAACRAGAHWLLAESEQVAGHTVPARGGMQASFLCTGEQ